MIPPLSINYKTKLIWLSLLYKKVDVCPLFCTSSNYFYYSKITKKCFELIIVNYVLYLSEN